MFASGKTAAVASAANYIEDVFSTYLYTGNSTSGGTQTITNSIDLSTKGGMVWIKGRSAASNHILTDTTRGAGTSATNNNALASNLTSEEDLGGSSYDYLSSFSTTGFVVTQGGTTTATRGTNYNNVTYASWTFRKQAKFFDVVTYTGNGSSSQAISHSLGSVPGCVIFKKTNSVEDWTVWHRSLSTDQYLILNSTSAVQTLTGLGPAAGALTSTTITVPEYLNSGSQPFVAYLFAHNAGGFGLTGTDNVISCGSMDGAAGTTVTLGYEPQFIMYKASTTTGNWVMVDNMRGMTTDGADQTLTANTSNTEGGPTTILAPNATGFSVKSNLTSGQTYIYIAIRRGPMKVPTSGTSVFSPVARTGTSATATVTGVGFPPDLFIVKGRSSGTEGATRDRLRGTNPALRTTTTNAESSTTTNGLLSYDMDGVTLGADNTGTDVNGQTNTSGNTYVNWLFRRAPSFFDEVCYTGTGTSTAFNHNLTVVPEMIITKIRNSAVPNWGVWHNALSPSSAMLFLNTTGTQGNGYVDTVTSTTFSFATANGVVNSSGNTYVAYLFASCSGVSKVGSYTGTATTLQVDCGFTGGARFVLIKRTDSTGAWYVWDTARGIVSGNDPYLLLNTTGVEVTNTDYVDTYSAGFEISSTAPAAINASGGTFIFLAIA